MARIYTVPRPYLITFHATGSTYPLTSDEAQRLLDEYPAVRATSAYVVLQGEGKPYPMNRTTIRPATAGGGAAFVIDAQADTCGDPRHATREDLDETDPDGAL